jgi:hypothetical protein
VLTHTAEANVAATATSFRRFNSQTSSAHSRSRIEPLERTS